MTTTLSNEDLRGILHGIEAVEHPDQLECATRRLSQAIEGGQRHGRDNSEWIAFEALFWQSIDSLEAILEDDAQTELILSRMEALGLSAVNAGLVAAPPRPDSIRALNQPKGPVLS